jgi:hypothetical protein
VIEVGYCFSYEFDKITQHDKLKLCIGLCSPLVAVGTKRSLNLFFSNDFTDVCVCPIWSTINVYLFPIFLDTSLSVHVHKRSRTV